MNEKREETEENEKMKGLLVEARVIRKNRLCWTLVSFWAIVLGVLFYSLSESFDLVVIFIILTLTSIVYTTIGELATKTMYSFWLRSVIVYPLGSVVAYVLNYFSPRYLYGSNDPYGFITTTMLYVLLLLFSFFGSSAGTLITRLVSGYEALCEEPVIVSYLIKGKIEDITALLESFLESLNVKVTKILTVTQKSMQFFNGSNEYFLFLNPLNDDSIEVNLVTLRWRRETIIEPNKEDLGIFLIYLESFLNKRKEEGKLGAWTSDFKSKYANTMKVKVWKDYTSPLQIKERLALRGLVSQKIVAFLTSHKKAIFTFIGGVLTVIIGELLIRYLIQMTVI